ncbi:MAG TPA: G5 domain-containing protein [Anaerolineales bacterium]|nr:G5 domain-containing protein [Anaerolineales bacterium]HMR98970.1 G5 domain-containing protein [Anaerolineales bacterium]HNQ94409.1 G5 domain-containing protein [Anaerolineales bacterium]HNS61279.1 G5 domain-containing protein [Anaerolineales bacterium]
MRTSNLKIALLVFLLIACQPAASQSVTIVDGDQILTIQTNERIPATILQRAGISITSNDTVLLNGIPSPRERPISNSLNLNSQLFLQIRRAIPVTFSAPQEQYTIQTSAFTVGEAMEEAGIQLHVGDILSQPIQSPVSNLESPITIRQARTLAIISNGKVITTASSAQTVGEALAEAGIPLVGGDYSIPSENEALPLDGQIKVVRVSESVILAQKPIPFTSEFVASADVALDQTQVLHPGETGLAIQRVRIRYEDGNEISRVTEEETVVRQPENRVVGYGTKIEIKTAIVDGVTIEYWRAVQMYVTSYSPCRSGGDRCYHGTSSGAAVQKGVAGMKLDWYLSMGGQQLFIPGYGFATVADVCGGCIGKPWIDVAYSDNDFVPWSSWVTVYFIAPAPANIIYVLE